MPHTYHTLYTRRHRRLALRSMRRALLAAQTLHHDGKAINIRAIAAMSGMSTSTTHKALFRLRQRGLVRFQDKSPNTLTLAPFAVVRYRGKRYALTLEP